MSVAELLRWTVWGSETLLAGYYSLAWKTGVVGVKRYKQGQGRRTCRVPDPFACPFSLHLSCPSIVPLHTITSHLRPAVRSSQRLRPIVAFPERTRRVRCPSCRPTAAGSTCVPSLPLWTQPDAHRAMPCVSLHRSSTPRSLDPRTRTGQEMSNNDPSTPSSPFPRSSPSPSAARIAAGRRIPSPINTRKDLTFEASKELGISLPAAAHSFRVTPPITPEKQRTTSERTEVVNHMPGGVGTEVGNEGEGESEMGGVGPADGSAASGSGASGWIGAGRERQSSVRGGAPPRQIQPPKDYSQFASSSSPTISAPAPNRSPARHQASLPYNITPRRTTSAQYRQTASQSSGPQPSVPNTPSPFLLTVVPPMHLPHNPPHPRTSQMCSGYGPPDKFRCVSSPRRTLEY